MNHNNNSNTKYNLFPKILFKPSPELPTRLTLTDRPPLHLKLKATLAKLTPQQPSAPRPGSVVSERVLKQYPKFCLNSQPLSIEPASSQPRLSEANTRYSRVSIVIRNQDGESLKKPVRRQKVNSLHTWVPTSLSALSPTAADSLHSQPLLILPLQSTRCAVNRDDNKLQAEVLLSCPTMYDTAEESPAGSLDSLDEKNEYILSANQSQAQLNTLESSLSNCNSQDKHSDRTLFEGSARSIEEEAQQKCLSSRTNLENSVADLNQQFSKQSVKAGRKLKVIKKRKTEKRGSSVPRQPAEEEYDVLASSRQASPENFVKVEKIEEAEEKETEEKEIENENEDAIREEVNDEDIANIEKRAKSKKRSSKRKQSNKAFRIRKSSRKISILLQNSYYKEDSTKIFAEKKKVKEEDSLFFLNESSSSDDNMFIEYVKTVKRKEMKMRNLQ